jgi:hypothetical protein
MSYEEKAKAILIKKSKELAAELIQEVIFEALKEAAAKSETKFDDLALAALEEPLKKAALELIEKIG